MSQNTLSVSEVGKSSALLQTGAGNSQSSGETSESGGFLSVLGSIFNSETEETEKNNPEKINAESLKVAETEENSESTAKLLELESDSADGGEDANTRLTDSSVEPELELKGSGEQKITDSMNEGSALLERLDESSQALKGNEPGKELPQQITSDLPDSEKYTDPAWSHKDTPINETLATKVTAAELESESFSQQPVHSEDLVSKYVRVEGQNDNTLSESETESLKKVSENLDAPEGKPITIVKGETPEAEVKAVQINHKVLSPDTHIKQSFDEAETMGVSQVTDPLANHTDLEPSAYKVQPDTSESKEAFIWNTGKTAIPVGAAAALSSDSVRPVHGVNTLNTAETPVDAKLVQQILNKDLSELTEEEIQILAQVSSGASTAVETSKPAPEMAKSAALNSSAFSLNQQHQAQQSSAIQHHAQLGNQSTDKAATQHLVQSANPAFNAVPIDAAHLSAQHAQVISSPNKTVSTAAMVASMSAAGAAGISSAKGKEKDKELSHQLAGMVGQQSVQQAQARSDIQQAVAQSPLQLTRDIGGEQLAERVQMMMSKNLKNVDIRLDPPELGRMQIRMSMNGDMATVQFSVSNSQARDVVEHAMPRLREMLSQQGIQLADSSVHQQNSGRQGQEYAAGNDSKGSGFSGGSSADEELNLDETINLNANIAPKDDGISYYA